MSQIVLTLALLALAWPLAAWMSLVYGRDATPADRVFGPIERALYAALGVDPDAPMGWRAWARALLTTNLALAITLYALFLAQGALPLNPDGVPGMSWDLALHTTASFISNTNQQHYSGQAQLSYLGQLVGVVTPMVVTPAIGLAVMVAALRGFGARDSALRRDAKGDVDLGNYHRDVVRSVTRVLLPLATVLALALTSQGVPSTLQGALHADTLDPAVAEQIIPVGPVAPMVAIKQLGTNGGGWYGPNSAFPLENPTPVSNALELASILLLPLASVLLAGRFLGRSFGRMTLVVMAVAAVAITLPVLGMEQGANPAFDGLSAVGPNWEGKELRFGVLPSALWVTFTTLTSNGSVNTMHDSLMPLSGLFPLTGMFINAIFGGDGVGVLNFLIYVLLAVFVSGLLVGRTPELFERKLDAREVRLMSLAALLPSVLVLLPTAWMLMGAEPVGPHGLTRVLYEYASANANNGSGFEGLGDNTVAWNVSCAVVLILARYVPILAPLAVAGLMAAKKRIPAGSGTLSLGSPAFGVTVVAVFVILQLLTFVPAVVLGPVAEQLVSVPALVAR